MTSLEFAEAMAYASIDPCGEYREELRHGQMMHLLDRAHFKRDAPLAPADFMNFVDRPSAADLPEVDRYAQIDKEVFGL